MASQTFSSPILDNTTISFLSTNGPTLKIIPYPGITKSPLISSSGTLKMSNFRAWNEFKVMLDLSAQDPLVVNPIRQI